MVALEYFGPSRAAAAAIWGLGRGVSVLLAFRLQRFAMVTAVCVVSARATARGAAGLLRQLGVTPPPPPGTLVPYGRGEARVGEDVLVWALALCGLQMQNARRMWPPLRLLLLPAYAVESMLRRLAIKMTVAKVDKAVR